MRLVTIIRLFIITKMAAAKDVVRILRVIMLVRFTRFILDIVEILGS
jgi:hypothetical protein